METKDPGVDTPPRIPEPIRARLTVGTNRLCNWNRSGVQEQSSSEIRLESGSRGTLSIVTISQLLRTERPIGKYGRRPHDDLAHRRGLSNEDLPAAEGPVAKSKSIQARRVRCLSERRHRWQVHSASATLGEAGKVGASNCRGVSCFRMVRYALTLSQPPRSNRLCSCVSGSRRTPRTWAHCSRSS